MSSSSRDFFPLYLEECVSSSGWVSLEQQRQDEVEEECERGDRDLKAEAATAAAKQQTLSLSVLAPGPDRRAFGPRATPGPPSEADLSEDYIVPAIELSRDMASTMEAQLMANIRNKTRRDKQTNAQQAQLQKQQQQQQQMMEAITTAAIPFELFHPAAAVAADSNAAAASSSSSSSAIVIDDGPVDLTLSPSPSPPPAFSSSVAAPPRPLFLPSSEPLALSAASAAASSSSSPPLQVFRPAATTTLQYRREMSALMFYLWDNVNWKQHSFLSVGIISNNNNTEDEAASLSKPSGREKLTLVVCSLRFFFPVCCGVQTAFLCDVFPFLRSLVFSALDSSPSAAVAAAQQQAAADAELAASLSARQGDGGRSTRRSTRAAARNEPKLSRKSVNRAHCACTCSHTHARMMCLHLTFLFAVVVCVCCFVL